VSSGDLPERPITILLAEDHRVVRAGLRLLLERHAGMAVVGEAGDIAETQRRAAELRPRVIVLDVDMPDGSSIPAIPRIRQSAPATRIVILTMLTAPTLAQEALRAGASGFVLKEAAETELIDAIRAVAAGGTYPGPEAGGSDAPARRTGRPDDLSARELEVLELIALGHTNGEIASRLFLSVRTVESHRANIQRKTRRFTRAELVAYSREHGIV
jgi:two-component system, NarL family, response regulator NreC